MSAELLDMKDAVIDGLRERIHALELYVEELEEELREREEAAA